jgi:CBS domain-containing protein
MRVCELMRKPVVFCRPDTNLAAAAALMWDQGCGALPIVNERGNVSGMITDRDICIALGTRNKRASELMVRDITHGQMRTCRPDDEIQTALKTMRQGRILRLPVVNSAGSLEGVLCMDDIVVRAQHCDGAKRPGISYEDVVNTLRPICQGHARCNKRRSIAA